jgi:hypothetical protein
MLTIFAPSERGGDQAMCALSIICSLMACAMLIFSYFKGNHWLTQRENKSLISELEKKYVTILVAFILLFETIYVNGQKFASVFVPSVTIHCWVFNNGIVSLTLLYGQLFKDHFKIASYLPYIMYQCTLMNIMLIRISSDNYFSNYDVILIFVFAGYTAFHTYSIPKCFLLDKDRLRIISSQGNMGSKDVFQVEEDTIELQEVNN